MLSPIITTNHYAVAGSLLYLVGAVIGPPLRRRRILWRGILAIQSLLWLGGWCWSAQVPAPVPQVKSPQSLSVPSLIASQPTTAAGNTVKDHFVQSCARCHGKDGKGNEAREDLPNIPDFTNHKWQGERTDAQLVASILEGKGKEMPSFASKFGPERAQELVAYIRQFDPEKAKPEKQ